MIEQASWVIRESLGLMFAASAFGKAVNFREFSRGVEEYRVLPRIVARPFAAVILVCESSCAVTYMTGTLLSYFIPISIVMLCSFAWAVSINLLNSRDIPCYCFGTDGEQISARTLARLAIALAGGLFLIIWQHLSPLLKPWSPRVTAKDYVIAIIWVGISIVGALWVIAGSEVVAIVAGRNEISLRRNSLLKDLSELLAKVARR